MRTCRICKSEFTGRYGKVFCSLDCKNEYHVKLRRATNISTRKIDAILHRNRSILLEVMGKNRHQKKFKKVILDKKRFNYSYITGIHINKQGKTVYHVYDFSYLIFSDQTVLVLRKKSDQYIN